MHYASKYTHVIRSTLEQSGLCTTHCSKTHELTRQLTSWTVCSFDKAQRPHTHSHCCISHTSRHICTASKQIQWNNENNVRNITIIIMWISN